MMRFIFIVYFQMAAPQSSYCCIFSFSVLLIQLVTHIFKFTVCIFSEKVISNVVLSLCFFVGNEMDSLPSSTNSRLHLLLYYSNFGLCFVILHTASYLSCANRSFPAPPEQSEPLSSLTHETKHFTWLTHSLFSLSLMLHTSKG